MTTKPTTVHILGGGFGGIYAALELDRTIARRPDVRVVLINQDNFFLFTPMLHEVAASDLDITDIVNPIRAMLHHVEFFEGTVENIDLVGRSVIVSHGQESHKHQLEYDQLLIALGSVTNFFHLPGLEEVSLTMKSLGDAILVRNHLISTLETADFECFAGKKSELTYVVCGGGFAGVETIGALNDFLREGAHYYPHIDPSDIRVVLVHDQSRILPEFSEELANYAHKKLEQRGVEVHVKSPVTGYKDGAVHTSTGLAINTRTVIWTAGVAPDPLMATLPCKKERGRLVANEFMQVTEFPGVWALGDCAWIVDPETNKPYPPTAQHAMRQGKIAGQNIAATIRGAKPKPFIYKSMGELAALGRRAGVANIMGIKFSGFIGWVLWRSIYLSKLPRFEKKIRVALNWALDLFFTKDLVQFLTVKAKTISDEGILEEDELAGTKSTVP
jgi:NADH dehydrogenase